MKNFSFQECLLGFIRGLAGPENVTEEVDDGAITVIVTIWGARYMVTIHEEDDSVE